MPTDLENLYAFINKLQEQYPSAMPLLNQPGVMAVYQQAISEGWSPERIQSALEQTPWWQQTDSTTRQWQALSATDPATAASKQTEIRQQFDGILAQTGVKLSQAGGLASPYVQLLNRAVTEGWDAARIKYEVIAEQTQPGASSTTGGEMATNAATVKSMANDYGVPLSDLATVQWAMQLSQGTVNPDGVKGYLIEQAKSLFPSLTTALDQGISVKQYAAPYLQLAQQELNINPSDINLTDPKWMKLLNQVDPKTGQRVSMSLDQALSTFRTDPAYGYDKTDKAKQDATQLATTLQQKMGAA